MSESSRWSFPPELQPTQSEVAFDLKATLDGVVALRSEVPDDAFTASILGTERLGNGVVLSWTHEAGNGQAVADLMHTLAALPCFA